MNPITYQELCYYINNRIKMILSRNINITYINIRVNKSFTSFIVNLNYIHGRKSDKFLKQYKLNIINLDNDIKKVIDDFDNLIN